MTQRLSTPPPEFKPEYMMLDLGFFGDPKVQLLEVEAGQLAPFQLLPVWMAIHQQPETRLHKKFLKVIARRHGWELPELEKVISIAESIGLIIVDGEYLTHQSIQRRVERAREKSLSCRRAAQTSRTQPVTKEVIASVERPLSVRSASAEQTSSGCDDHDTDHDRNTDLDTDHKTDPDPKTSDPPFKPNSRLKTEMLRWADEQLESTDALIVQNSPYFAGTGKRPMKLYPEIWLNVCQLAETCERLHEAGIPENKFHLVFENCRNRVTSNTKNNRLTGGLRLESLAVESWLTTFCMTDVQKELINLANLKRAQTNYERVRTE